MPSARLLTSVLLLLLCAAVCQAWGRPENQSQQLRLPRGRRQQQQLHEEEQEQEAEAVQPEPSHKRGFSQLLKNALGPEIQMMERELNRTRDELRGEVANAENEYQTSLKGAKYGARSWAKEWKKAIDPEIEYLVNKWLSDDNLKSTFKAYQQYRHLLDSPRLKRLIKDLGVSEMVSKRATAVLNSKVSPHAAVVAHIAVNVTAEVVADALEAPRNRAASTHDIMHEMAEWAQDVDGTLTYLVESKAISKMCPEEYRPIVAKLVKSRAIPRILLTSTAALLHGFDPREDPLLNAMIVFYAVEHMTQGMVMGALALLDDVWENDDEDPDASGAAEAGGGERWLDNGLQGLLDASMDSANKPSFDEMAEAAYAFFAELSAAVHSEPTAQSPKSTDVGGSSSAASGSSTGSSSSAVSEGYPQHKQAQHWPFHKIWPFKRLKARKELPPMAHELIVHRSSHLSTACKVVLKMARIARHRGISRRAHAAAKAQGVYSWGGMFKMAPSDAETAAQQRKHSRSLKKQQARSDAAEAAAAAAAGAIEDVPYSAVEGATAARDNADGTAHVEDHEGQRQVDDHHADAELQAELLAMSREAHEDYGMEFMDSDEF